MGSLCFKMFPCYEADFYHVTLDLPGECGTISILSQGCYPIQTSATVGPDSGSFSFARPFVHVQSLRLGKPGGDAGVGNRSHITSGIPFAVYAGQWGYSPTADSGIVKYFLDALSVDTHYLKIQRIRKFTRLHLILCDREENKDVLEGVKYELQDCVFENVANIRVSCNFCEEFRMVDLAIILPSPSPDHHGYSDVEVSHSFLPERDFRCLEGAVHKKSVRRKDSLFIHARGPLSKAYGISKYIKEAYQDSIKTVKLPKLEDPTIPTLSSIQIYGAAGCDLYDELILPKVYPTTLNKLQQMYHPTSDTMSTGMSTQTKKEELFERLHSNNQNEQVLLIYALEHLVDSHDCHEDTVEREQTDLWSRL